MKNLYRDKITSQTLAGARPHPDWLILEVVPESAMSASSDSKKAQINTNFSVMKPQLSTDNVIEAREPVVFKVLASGSNVDFVSPNDYVNITFLAGDKFGNSPIVLCHKDDVTLVWGSGLHE